MPEIKGPPFTISPCPPAQHLEGDLSLRQSDGRRRHRGKTAGRTSEFRDARSRSSTGLRGASVGCRAPGGRLGRWDTRAGRCPRGSKWRWQLTQAPTQQTLPLGNRKGSAGSAGIGKPLSPATGKSQNASQSGEKGGSFPPPKVPRRFLSCSHGLCARGSRSRGAKENPSPSSV